MHYPNKKGDKMKIGSEAIYNGKTYKVVSVCESGMKPIIIEREGRQKIVRLIDGKLVSA